MSRGLGIPTAFRVSQDIAVSRREAKDCEVSSSSLDEDGTAPVGSPCCCAFSKNDNAASGSESGSEDSSSAGSRDRKTASKQTDLDKEGCTSETRRGPESAA